jgi:hypothetical protein
VASLPEDAQGKTTVHGLRALFDGAPEEAPA